MRHFIAIVSTFCLVASASAQVTIYDSGGFEGYSLGALNGQDGWGTSSFMAGNMPGGSGTADIVTGAGEQTLGNQSLRLHVDDVVGDTINIDLPFADLVAAGYTEVTASMDIYRENDGWNSNLWYWGAGNNPTYGLQWDASGSATTLPVGFGGAGTATVLDGWATLSVTWNFVTGDAIGDYNGLHTVLANDPTSYNEFNGWHMHLIRENADPGRGAETLWIDNLTVTAIPEPATLALFGIGALAMLRRRK